MRTIALDFWANLEHQIHYKKDIEEGRITRDSVVRITRGSEKVYEGPIASLKHFKDEVKEIKAGTECGMVFEKFNDIQPEDMIEAHIMVEVPR